MNDGGTGRWARALVIGAALAVAAAACSSDEPDQSSGAAPPTTSLSVDNPSTTVAVTATTTAASLFPPTSNAVFDAGSDDLCEWVTGDDVTEFLAAAGTDVEGPAEATELPTDDAMGWSCAWMLASGEEIQLGAITTPPTAGVSSRRSALQQLDMITDYEQPGDVMSPGAVVSGHPELSDGVVVENEAFLRFTFYTPEGENQLSVVLLPGDGRVEEPDGSTDRYETIVMATAEAILEELGWVGA